MGVAVIQTTQERNRAEALVEYRATAPEWAPMTAGLACKQIEKDTDPALLVAEVKRKDYALGNNFQAALRANGTQAIGFLNAEMYIQCPEHFKY